MLAENGKQLQDFELHRRTNIRLTVVVDRDFLTRLNVLHSREDFRALAVVVVAGVRRVRMVVDRTVPQRESDRAFAPLEGVVVQRRKALDRKSVV